MKILFMNAECSNDVDYIHRHFFEQAVGRIADCKWAGHGHELHVSGEDLNDTVRRVMPDADWVIINEVPQIRFKGAVRVPEKRICKVAYVTGDVYWNPPLVAERLNAGKWDAFLMESCKLDTFIPSSKNRIPVKADPDFYIKHLDAPIFRMLHSINPEFFKPSNREKKYDASFIGAHHPTYYPLRAAIWNDLPRLAALYKWRVLIRSSPPGISYKRKIDELLKKDFIVGARYAEEVALSKIFMVSTGPGRYPVKKYFEGMASGTCVLGDSPMIADEIYFKSGYNFVEIDEGNWQEKLKYYLEHDEEREEIARRGYETIMKYHTNSVRAKQLIDFLEEYK